MAGMPSLETIFSSMRSCIKNRMYCRCPALRRFLVVLKIIDLSPTKKLGVDNHVLKIFALESAPKIKTEGDNHILEI